MDNQNSIFKSLLRGDKKLRPLVKLYAPVDFYHRKPKPPFHTLVSMIISQQLSTKAANTIQQRLLDAQGGRYFSPQKLSLVKDMRLCGVSRQKQIYIQALIDGAISGALNFKRLRVQSNEEVRSQLMLFPGVGGWTADVFLLANFRRQDVFPAGDLILQKFLQRHYALPATSKLSDYAEFAERWQPYRSLVSLLFWKAANMPL